MDMTPIQIIALCVLFMGFHAVAIPAFVWAWRSGQFSGPEQAEWHLDHGEPPDAPPTLTPLTPRRARLMLSLLVTLGVLMISSVAITVVMASRPAAHSVAGKCPF